MSSMKDILGGVGVLPPELPTIHTSRCEHLAAIIAARAISPRHCKVFNESLVYLFYGRPAYRSKQGTTGDGNHLCPICFVFRPRTVAISPRRVFPCDTGAVFEDRFDPHLHPTDLMDLELDATIQSAQKLVATLFDTNGKYFVGSVKDGMSFTSGTIADRFYGLLCHTGPAGFDDRKSAIEVQISQPASLINQLLFVVLPREYLEDMAIRNTILHEWNCDPVPYPTFHGASPTEYYSVVRNEIARRFNDSTRI